MWDGRHCPSGPQKEPHQTLAQRSFVSRHYFTCTSQQPFRASALPSHFTDEEPGDGNLSHFSKNRGLAWLERNQIQVHSSVQESLISDWRGVFLRDLSHFDSSLTSPCCLCIVGVRFIDKTVLCSRTTCVLTVVPTTVQGITLLKIRPRNGNVYTSLLIPLSHGIFIVA